MLLFYRSKEVLNFLIQLFLWLNTPSVHIPKRENVIVNRLNKTKVERDVDHEQERVERIKKENAEKRVIAAQNVRFTLSRFQIKH